MTKNNKIAITGCSFDFCSINKIDDFWSGLINGDYLYHHDVNENDELIQAWGSVGNLKGFDHHFFGYSYHEACKMDPQHRHLLQHCWLAMENAGYMNKRQLPMTAVFASASENHYLWHNLAGEIQAGVENEALLGNLPDFLATRIAWKLGATGQAITVQCGCSSGLAALHQARVALLTGQAEMALVGAVSLAAPHQQGYKYLPGGIRSADGKVRVFDRHASGTVFTNGVAALVLKPLHKALEQGDNILGVIESSALNNDGGDKAGFTAPSVSGQSKVIRRAMRLAGIKPDEIGLYEAHGTGTRLGDPIEFAALSEAWQDHSLSVGSCALQSVKANLGHLDTVSGLAGVIKACLVLKHRKLPPQLNYQQPNPHIDLEGTPFFINHTAQRLSENARFASVSALGIGGTNAHAILSGPPDVPAVPSLSSEGLFLLSAPNQKSLQRVREAWAQWPGKDGAIEKAAELSREGRTAFRVRQSIWVSNAEELKQKLSQPTGAASVVNDSPSIILMFTGQGSQYTGMGKNLYRDSVFFREKLDEKLAVLQQLSGDNYQDILFEVPDAIHQPQYTQAGLLALEVTLAEYIQHCGVRIDMLLGHSLGEYAAMVVSQALTFQDAAKLVLLRAQLVQQSEPGGMCSVMAGIETVRPLLEGTELDIAALNSSTLSVVSGREEEIQRFMARAEQHTVMCQPLKVKRAFHSRLLEPVLPAYRQALQEVTFLPPQIRVISTLTGKEEDVSQYGQPDYWIRQMREPVAFAAAIRCAESSAEHLCFVEIGPGQTLKTLASQTTRHSCINLLPHPGEADKANKTLFTGFGQLWEQGVNIQWQNLRDQNAYSTCPPLPGYPFELTECWIEPSVRQETLALQRYLQCWVPLTGQEKEETRDKPGNWLLITDGSAHTRQQAQQLSTTLPGSQIISFESEHFLATLKNTSASIAVLFDPDHCGQQAFTPLLTVLTLIRQLPLAEPRRLTIVTRSAIDLMAAPCPALAALTSAVKSLNQEYPALRSRLIDTDGQDLALLTGEMEMTFPTIVALRQSDRLTEGFLPAPTPVETHRNSVPRSILIMGGGGQVGLQYARTFLENSQARVCLLQRSSLAALKSRSDNASQLRAARIEALMQRWPDRLTCCVADVECQESLLTACKQVRGEMGSLDLLIHTAGVDASMHYQLIRDVDADFCQTSFAAKSRGLQHMAKVAEVLSIPHCHVVSSISSALGGIGMYIYGSLHAWLDAAVATLRRQHPSRWTLLNWEAWEFGNDDEVPDQFRQGAFGSELNRYAMQPSQGRHFLWQCWSHLQGPSVVSSTDFQQRYQQWVSNQLTDSDQAEEEQTPKAPRPEMSSEYQPAQGQVEEKILAIWESLLGLQGIGIDDNFFELGGHSLLALKMTGLVNQSISATISMVDIFQYPTIRKLAASVTDTKDFRLALSDAEQRAQKRRQMQRRKRA